ncbi:MerR family transcriptional regulator [Paenibacillus sp. 8b26]|uniref:MerR family transcriptional regulator n=1 Tax=Paenibacillus sp. 8b26 TaxID=3424133 RepID=UPI003D65D0DC
MKEIKDVVSETGVTASALRFYESMGLLPYVKRTQSGIRLYDDEDIKWVDFVTALRRTSMSISQIQEYVRLYKEGDHTISKRKMMMIEHKKAIEEKMEEIYRNLDKINYKLALYDVMEAQMNNDKIKI